MLWKELDDIYVSNPTSCRTQPETGACPRLSLPNSLHTNRLMHTFPSCARAAIGTFIAILLVSRKNTCQAFALKTRVSLAKRLSNKKSRTGFGQKWRRMGSNRAQNMANEIQVFCVSWLFNVIIGF